MDDDGPSLKCMYVIDANGLTPPCRLATVRRRTQACCPIAGGIDRFACSSRLGRLQDPHAVIPGASERGLRRGSGYVRHGRDRAGACAASPARHGAARDRLAVAGDRADCATCCAPGLPCARRGAGLRHARCGCADHRGSDRGQHGLRRDGLRGHHHATRRHGHQARRHRQRAPRHPAALPCRWLRADGRHRHHRGGRSIALARYRGSHCRGEA